MYIWHMIYSSLFSSSFFSILFHRPKALVLILFNRFSSYFFLYSILKYFQKELPGKHETDHDGFLNKAFAIKYNAKKMKKLEKDFSIQKKEEQEEQVEMRVRI